MTDHLVATVQKHVPNIPLKIISQGAEALVFETTIHPYSTTPSLHNNKQFIIKFRPPKPYRHPKIDASITKSRTIGEVKFIYKLEKLGIAAPSVISADFPNGIIWMEHLGSSLPDGNISSLKNWLWYLEKQGDVTKCVDERVKSVCNLVGELIGRLHLNDMVHGDLTSSNILLTDDYKVPALIDFGLSSFSNLPEDKAVDLYVLERAILSTHSVFADTYNAWLLEGYETIHHSVEFKKDGKVKYKDTIRRLEDVRLRGRKRSLI
ncbi:BUD32 EKC/KEOPS complex subunit BUD32 [Candida maltosa Xu316]|uniref:EKC/KEOPS complex subunit BUD32 n=1 Tax=Candida maltosa (strain Xu316) TaxID=1245528 RepID=M3JVX3_CANMX|nr:Serine/threonine-protein kinase BUD32 [Candida maltosa Xu316]